MGLSKDDKSLPRFNELELKHTFRDQAHAQTNFVLRWNRAVNRYPDSPKSVIISTKPAFEKLEKAYEEFGNSLEAMRKLYDKYHNKK